MRCRSLLLSVASLVALPLGAADWSWIHNDDSGARSGRSVDAANGTAYVVTTNATEDGHVLTRYEPDGSIAWRREHPNAWTYQGAAVRAGGGRVCIAGGAQPVPGGVEDYYVACYTQSDGELLWRTIVARDDLQAGGGYFLTLRSDRDLVLFGRESRDSERDSVRHYRISADGVVLHAIELRTIHAFQRDFDHSLRADGAGIFALNDDAAASPVFKEEYSVFDADGRVTRTVDMTALTGLRDPRVTLAPNDVLWVLGEGPEHSPDLPDTFVARLDGATPPMLLDFGNQYGQITGGGFTFHGNDVYVLGTFQSTSEYADYRTLFARVHPQVRIVERGNDIGDFFAFDGAGSPHIFNDEGHRLAIRSYDRATGDLTYTRHLPLPCPAEGTGFCFVNSVRTVNDGSVRVFGVLKGNLRTRRDRLYSLSSAFVRPPAARVDQPGLRGAWYPNYGAGQGFVLDYFPGTRTIFAPWFTFDTTLRTTPAGLRWYSLQGAAAPNATRVTLDILENRGGAFASAPETNATRVGSATLEVRDCANGSLVYTFDDGRTGAITLTRLTPATEACIRADGSTQSVATTPADGFDARQSGAWFVPGQSGQGTMFTVQPRGLFFGAWFTYDPQGASDDPRNQHWFALQGDLAGATSGTVVVPILRTTGAQFDGPPATATTRVGTATVRFNACDRATLEYAFDDSDAAAAFRTRTGSLALEKIGGCNGPPGLQ